jgi:predicted O-methyltransferase YrrM
MRIEALRRLNRRLKPHRRRVLASALTLLGRRDDAVVALSRIVPGMFSEDETRLLYRTVREAPGPGDIAEIGSWMGRTSVIMGMALRDAATPDCVIWAIDHHVGSEEHASYIEKNGSTLDRFRRNIANAGLEDRIQELVMKSGEASQVLAERGVRLRMTFIDGAHDEDSVREDIGYMLPLMTPGGIVAFHDCSEGEDGFPGVWRAIQSELGSRVDIVDRADTLLVTRLRS